MITIEWASSFRRDGSRRKPSPSTIHGWLAKWRGTFLGDERLRSMGMREMREARYKRSYNAAKKRQASSGKGIFSFFSIERKKPSKFSSRSTRPRTSARDGGRTARTKDAVRATHAQRPAKSKGHKPSQVDHKPNSKAPASRPHNIPRKRR